MTASNTTKKSTRKSAKRSTKAKAPKDKAKAKASSTKKKAGYKRGSLSAAVYAYFDKVEVDEAKYDDVLALAKKIMPKTKFNKYHLSWYKNKYRQDHE